MPDPQLFPGRLCEDRQELSVGHDGRMESREKRSTTLGGRSFFYNLEGQRPGSFQTRNSESVRSPIFFFFSSLSNGGSDVTRIR